MASVYDLFKKLDRYEQKTGSMFESIGGGGGDVLFDVLSLHQSMNDREEVADANIIGKLVGNLNSSTNEVSSEERL